jgi:hypothetical protein
MVSVGDLFSWSRQNVRVFAFSQTLGQVQKANCGVISGCPLHLQERTFDGAMIASAKSPTADMTWVC